MNSLPLLELWYTALREPVGVSILCSDPQRLRARLYKARSDADDPQLKALMVHTSPRNPNGEVWITHRNISELTHEELRKAQDDGEG